MSLMTKLWRSNRKLTQKQLNIDENEKRMRENTGFKYIEQTKGTNEIIDEATGENND